MDYTIYKWIIPSINGLYHIAQEVFSGTPPTCVQTTTVTTMTSTVTELVACSGGVTTDWGVNVNDCFGKVNGQTCTVSCMATFQGEALVIRCRWCCSFEHSMQQCWASFLNWKVQMLSTRTEKLSQYLYLYHYRYLFRYV